MKHGKRPTLKQRKRIAKLEYRGRKLNPESWFVVKDTSKEFVLVNKLSGHQEPFLKN